MARQRVRRGTAIDWLAVKRDYIEGIVGPNDERMWPTIDDLAARLGVSHDAVKVRSAQGAWPDAREQFRVELDGERRRAIFESRKEQLVSIDKRALTSAEAGIALVGTALSRIVREQNVDAGLVPPRIDPKQLTGLGLAAKRFMEVKAAATGQVAPSEQETLDEVELAARRAEESLAARIQAHVERRAEPFYDEHATATG